jgi:hypothetical protein
MTTYLILFLLLFIIELFEIPRTFRIQKRRRLKDRMILSCSCNNRLDRTTEIKLILYRQNISSAADARYRLSRALIKDNGKPKKPIEPGKTNSHHRKPEKNISVYIRAVNRNRERIVNVILKFIRLIEMRGESDYVNSQGR